MIDFTNIKNWYIGNTDIVKASINGTVVWEKKSNVFVYEVSGSGNKTLMNPSTGSGYQRLPNSVATIAIESMVVYDGANNPVTIYSYGDSSVPRTYNFTTDGDHEVHIVFRQHDTTNYCDFYKGMYYMMPRYMYHGCSITSIKQWPDNLEIIGDGAFRNCTITNGAAQLPPNLLAIGHDALNSCANIAKTTGVLDLGNRLTSLGKYTFYGGKTNLTHIIIRSPLSDTGIDSYFNSYSIFNNQSADIVITEGCTRFCKYMFSNTSGKVYCLGTTPPTFPTPTGSISRTFYVPIGYGDVYKAAWNGIISSNKIVEGACPYNV